MNTLTARPATELDKLVTSVRVAVSLHIYGTDLSRVGSSVRRFYDLPAAAGRQ